MAEAGRITINLSAGTAQFVLEMEKAKAKMREFGQHGVSNVQATSAALRVLEGNMTNNLRAAERFLAQTLHLGGALKVAFPVVGAVALGGVLAELADKGYNAFKALRDGPEKASGAFRQLSEALGASNDELRVTNDRLANDIAKLEGRHQNTLALSLDQARVAADKLAESLDKDLDKLNEVLKNNEIGRVKSFFTGKAQTSDLRENLFGETGYGGFRSRIDQSMDAGFARVAAAKTARDAQAARDALFSQIEAAYSGPVSMLQKRIADAEVKQGKGQAPTYQAYVKNPSAYAPWGAQAGQSDQTQNIEESQGALHALMRERDSVLLQARNAKLSARRDQLSGAADNTALDRPYEDRLKALAAQLEQIRSKFAAVGQDSGAQVLLKTYGDAVKAIEEVNKALERHHAVLTQAQQGQITNRILEINQAEAEGEWKSKLDSASTSINERIRSQEMLTAAIGKGYAAQRTANVETQLMSTLGQHYNDAAWMQAHQGDVAGLRSGYGREYDARHAEQVASAIDKLRDQIELERALAAVQIQGAEAVRRVQLAARLAKLEDAGATKEQIAAERELFDAQRANLSAETTALLMQRIEATEKLTSALWQGAEAARQARLENGYSQQRRAGGTPIPGVVGMTVEELGQRSADSAEHEMEVTAQAARRVNLYSDQLAAINEQVRSIDRFKALQGDTQKIEMALRDLENERLKAMSEQLQQAGSLQDGIRAFFLDMQREAARPGQILHDGLKGAFDGVSGDLARLATGGLGKHETVGQMFGRTLQGVGQNVAHQAFQGLMQKGLGHLGKVLGVDIPGAGKRDGSSKDRALWVCADQTGIPGATDPNADPSASGGLGSLGSLGSLGGLLGKLGGIFSGGAGMVFHALGNMGSLLSFGGAFAGGGDVYPGSAYLVGEQGPELFRPPTAGTIVPNGKVGGGPNVTYAIDARGTDPVQTETRVRQAVIAAHRDAIATAIVATHERAQRTPKRVS